MAQAQYTRSQLRDVLVEFYSRVDPSRLDAGIDINGMIDWIIYHGPDDMNARLMAKYGQGLNFDILKQPKQHQSAMHRISMMPNTQLIEQQQKRLELRAKVEAFYKENDPDKLGTVDTFVEWIEVNGEKAFNDLLMKKYGKAMGVVTRNKPTPPTPPASVAAAQQQAPAPQSSPGPSAAKTAPSLPPRQNTAPAGPDPALIEKLNRFYALHEPDQPNDPLPIAEWASQVGLAVLNEKLMQLYGGSLETLEADEARVNEPPPPPPEDDVVDEVPPPPQDEEEEAPQEEPAVADSEWGEPEPEVPKMPEPPKPPTITMAEPPKPPPAPVLEPPKPRFTEPPKKPEPPKISVAKPAAPPKAPGPPSFIPKPAASALPSIPVYSVQGLAKPAPPAAPSFVKQSSQTSINAAVAAQGVKPPAPNKQRKRRPSEGACDKYVLDLSGDGFGVCVCGFNRAAHNQPKVTGTDRRSIRVKAPAVKQSKPCNAYRVDVSGKNFGDCVCGWAKTDHGKIDWHPPIEIKIPTPQPQASTPRATETDPNAIVEMVFDQATTTVFNMMVESYIEQHGEEPDSDTKIDWASNLAILSAGKDPTNGTKLKIRAKALPKNRKN